MEFQDSSDGCLKLGMMLVNFEIGWEVMQVLQKLKDQQGFQYSDECLTLNSKTDISFQVVQMELLKVNLCWMFSCLNINLINQAALR